ncbi:hypothetical protein FS837_002812, partial [Tulasnella sp. UAMH 9824]
IVHNDEKKLSPRVTVEIIRRMQEQNPTIFTKRGSYDGRKNLYSSIQYPLGTNYQFEVDMPEGPSPQRVRIKWVATINPASTARYVEGKMTYDEKISTTLNACNVALRMQPIQKHPFNAKSFFTDVRPRDARWGVELWRGYFQSVRPVIGKMVVNVDISSAAFYKPGPLIGLCLEYLEASPKANPVQFLSSNRLNTRTRVALAKFLRTLRVRTTHGGNTRVRSIRSVSEQGANNLPFELNGTMISVAEYFLQETGSPLRYPNLVCVQLSKTAWLPLELCDVPPGQFYRNTLRPEQTKSMVGFSSLRPEERLRDIRNGLQTLQYSSSPYLQDFEINVDPNPMNIKGRILPTPTLLYGRNAAIQPRDGKWNMLGKSLYRPQSIQGCAIIVYSPRRFSNTDRTHLKQSLFDVTTMLGMQGMPADPPVLEKDGTGTMFASHLKEAALMCHAATGKMPNLIIAVLPDMAEDIYTRIKNAGDIKIGVATQCLRGSKCGPEKGDQQYFVNYYSPRINAKLGGINVIPKPDTVRFLTDPATPTIVIGADVHHPGPGVTNRPSYAAVVGSVDSDASKYVAVSKPQEPRVEMIQSLADMITHILKTYMRYRKDVEKNANPAPRRMLFYRDGISEGEFQQCKKKEVEQIFQACDNIGIPRPKLTFVVVGKGGCPADRKSGNAQAGLVIDRDITSPVEYDFYLQSHGGLLGTSRSSHYNVLEDQNNFMPDDLQRISFSLCHVYARSTRSVSIVSPVYYADLVCTRSKHHYDPDGAYGNLSDSVSQVSSAAGLAQAEAIMRAFQPVHPNTGHTMYFQ